MNALTNTTMFIIATVLALTTPATPTSATTIVTGTGAGVHNVESDWDNTEVANRDKTGTTRPSNFAPMSQAKKKQALTRRACLQAERAGLNQARFCKLLKHLYLGGKCMSGKDLDSLESLLKQHGFLLSRTVF